MINPKFRSLNLGGNSKGKANLVLWCKNYAASPTSSNESLDYAPCMAVTSLLVVLFHVILMQVQLCVMSYIVFSELYLWSYSLLSSFSLSTAYIFVWEEVVAVDPWIVLERKPNPASLQWNFGELFCKKIRPTGILFIKEEL